MGTLNNSNNNCRTSTMDDPSRNPNNKRAYVTFLAGDGDYVKGVIGLAKGLRKINSLYPLLVAVLPDVPDSHRRILAESYGCIIREINPVNNPSSSSTTSFAMAYYVINYSKLRIWEFAEYRKLVYLDGDIQVYDNIDHLFDLPDGYLYAALDCFCEKTWRFSMQYKIGYCQQFPVEKRVMWDEDVLGCPKPITYFNAGMFVFEPSLGTYRDLLKTLKVTPPGPFAEQDFLNMYFKDIYRPIPQLYNLVMALMWHHPENIDLYNTKVVHYCADGSKPWRYTGQEDNMDREDIKLLVKRWWDIYNDPSLDYLPTASITTTTTTADNTRRSVHDEQQIKKKKVTPLKEAAGRAVRYITTPSAA